MKILNRLPASLLICVAFAASAAGTLTLEGCAEDRPLIEFVHDGRSGLEGIEVAGRSWKELSGGMAFDLSITNTASEELSGVRVVLNDEYCCGLEALMEYRGVFTGTVPHGRSALRPNETVAFRVNHDTSNGWVMRNATDQPLPDDVELASVTLEAGGSSGRWVRPAE